MLLYLSLGWSPSRPGSACGGQIAIHQIPATERLFRITASPQMFEIGVELLAGQIPVTLIELGKLVPRTQPASP